VAGGESTGGGVESLGAGEVSAGGVVVSEAGGVVLSTGGVESGGGVKSVVEVVIVASVEVGVVESVEEGEEFSASDGGGAKLPESVLFVSIDVNTLAFLTTKAIQLNLMSSGADLFMTIVNPLTLF